MIFFSSVSINCYIVNDMENIYSRPHIYDLALATGDKEGLVYAQLAERSGMVATPRLALELGSGSGRLMKPLAQAGWEVIGIEINPAMCSYSKGMLSGLPAWSLCADMAKLPVKDGIPFIYSAVSTFRHLLTTELIDKALGGISRILSKKGICVIDTSQPSEAYPNEEFWATEGDGLMLSCMWRDVGINNGCEEIELDVLIESDDGPGELIRHSHLLHILTPEDWHKHLFKNGLRLLAVYNARFDGVVEELAEIPARGRFILVLCHF